MANRNDEYGREQQSSTYGQSGNKQDRQQASGQGPSRYQSQSPESQNQQSQRYQSQGQGQGQYQQPQPQYQPQGGQQRHGAGNEYGSEGYTTQGQAGQRSTSGEGRGWDEPSISEFDERAQSWEQERGSDYSPSYASQESGRTRQQGSGQQGKPGQPSRFELGNSQRSESSGYGSYSATGGRGQGEGYGSSSGYGGGIGSEYGAQGQGQQFLRPGDTQSSARSGMSGSYGESGMYGTSSGRSSSGLGNTGLGPKNYTRSDARITEDLCERLTQDDDIDASDIEVKAQQGVVTLEGTVEQRWMKHRAEDLAESCSGVREVENKLKVQAGTGHSSGFDTMGKGSQGRSQQAGASGKSTTGSTSPPSSGTTPH